MKKPIFIILILLLGFTALLFYQEKIDSVIENKNQTFSDGCLKDSWEVDYEFEIKKTPLSDVNIFIKNKDSQEIISFFQIENIRKNYHPIELHKCSVYIIRMFNYDYQKTKQEPGYKAELWKYDYNGKGEFILLFHEKISKDGEKIYKSYYGTDFRISPDEKYAVLEKWTITEFDKGGYVDGKDKSIVIKNINTKENIFILSAKSIRKQNPNVVGSFGFDKWTEDGRYFWGVISEGAYVKGYFRIDTQNWKTDIFEAPNGAMSGSPLNINTGYFPIQPGQVWTGDFQMTQELKEQYKKEGKKSLLYLYNLFTKKKIFIVDNEEPLWWFKPRWLSDTELEYELPNGEKKIYEIKSQ